MTTSQSAEVLDLRARVQQLLARNTELQRHVDREGARLASSVTNGIYDAATAQQAVDQFDDQWFSSLPYSPSVVRSIASSLMGVLSAYPFIDASTVRAHAEEPRS